MNKPLFRIECYDDEGQVSAVVTGNGNTVVHGDIRLWQSVAHELRAVVNQAADQYKPYASDFNDFKKPKPKP